MKFSNTTKIITILVFIASFIFVFTSNKNKQHKTTTFTKKETFSINLLVTGELEAKNKEWITAPEELMNQNLGYIRVKIQDIVPEGTVVDSGDFVARLDQSELVNKLTEIENEITKKENELLKIKLDTMLSMRNLRKGMKDMKYGLEELKLTVEQSVYEPPATLRKAELTYEKSQREYKQAQDDYHIKVKQEHAKMVEAQIALNDILKRKSQVQELLDKLIIYAQKPGMVIYARNQMGQIKGIGSEIEPWDRTVATLPDMSVMISKTFVNEIDINKIKTGQNVLVSLDAYPDTQVEGSVISVANVGTQQMMSTTKKFEVIIEIPKPAPVMKPGMTTANTIICATYENVISVPLEAVHANDTMQYVFIQQGIQQVVAGESNENFIIIEKGLTENQEIFLGIPENAEDMHIHLLPENTADAENSEQENMQEARL